MDSTFYSLVLGTHILGGMSALLSGPIAIASPQESRQQKNFVFIFFIAMLATCLSGAVMSVVLKNPFLFVIAVFSFYSVFTGFRPFTQKTYRPSAPEWIAVLISVPAAVYMFSTGVLVLIIFGSLFTLQLIQDFFALLKKENFSEEGRVIQFLGRYCGAYIATTTAFIVVNFSGSAPDLLLWLGPSLVGTPAIVFLVARTKKKYAVE